MTPETKAKVLNSLSQPSTWVGIISGICMAFGFTVSATLRDQLATFATQLVAGVNGGIMLWGIIHDENKPKG